MTDSQGRSLWYIYRQGRWCAQTWARSRDEALDNFFGSAAGDRERPLLPGPYEAHLVSKEVSDG